MDKVICVIDLKSFYASCECVARNLDCFTTPLVCCDPYRSGSSVVMSVSPYLKKKYHIPNVCRKRDLPNIKGMIYAVPRMSYYLKMQSRVIEIFLRYIAPEDLYIYSVDECFLNIGPYLNLYKMSPFELTQKIMKEIKEELGLYTTCGAGPNLFLAKCALDQEGKKNPPYYAYWGKEEVKTKLWNIKPIDKIWGIAGGLKNHLRRIGINSLKQLAVTDDDLLKKEFGIIGNQLKALANGIDESDIRSPYIPRDKSLSLGQTLKRPYSFSEGKLLLREMVDDLTGRLREKNLLTRQISLYVGYNQGARNKMMTLAYPTDSRKQLFDEVLYLYEVLKSDDTFRQLSLSYADLKDSPTIQQSLFSTYEDDIKQERIDKAIDNIQRVFGKNAVMRCSSLKDYSTYRQRNNQIGGHRE